VGSFVSMSPVSEGEAATSSNRLRAGLQLVETALSQTSLDVLSTAIDKDDTQVCKIRSGQIGAQIKDVVKLLHAAGLKVVPADRICVARDKFQAMVTIASAAMSCPDTVKKLTWDES
jgi:enolase